MSDYEKEGYPIDFSKSPASIGRQIQRNNEIVKQDSEVVEAVPIQDDIFYGLKRDLVNFFSNRMGEIKAKDAIQRKVIEKLSDMLDNDDLEFEQLMNVYRTISSDSRNSTDSLLALFRPTPGVASPFAENVAQKDEKQDAFDQVYENMTSEDLENIDVLLKLMRTANKKSHEE